MARGNDPKEETKPSPPAVSTATPMVRAVALLDELADLLVAADAARGDADATKDAGQLAGALYAAGGALADEQQPWPLKHALDRNPSHADPDGTDRVMQFAGAWATAKKHGTRRKALGLGPQAGLALFARIAVNHAAQRTAVVALDEAKAAAERARQQADRIAHEKRGARPPATAPRPSGASSPPDDDEPDPDPFKV